jgi:hypothetical protein
MNLEQQIEGETDPKKRALLTNLIKNSNLSMLTDRLNKKALGGNKSWTKNKDCTVKFVVYELHKAIMEEMTLPQL